LSARANAHRILAWTLAVGAFLGGGCGGAYVAPMHFTLTGFESPFHPRPVEASLWSDAEWKKSECSEMGFHSIRQRMVDDLLANHLRPGMTRDEVESMIGPHDPDSYYREPDPLADVYRLGLERGFGVDNEWLFVRFGDDDRLLQAFLATD
jgi:hypothetical protein